MKSPDALRAVTALVAGGFHECAQTGRPCCPLELRWQGLCQKRQICRGASRRVRLESSCARHKYQNYEGSALETEPGVLSSYAIEAKLAGHSLQP
jgi:hypothetical protein